MSIRVVARSTAKPDRAVVGIDDGPLGPAGSPGDGRCLDGFTERSPGTGVKRHLAEGDDLADLLFQDANGLELADVYLGPAPR